MVVMRTTYNNDHNPYGCKTVSNPKFPVDGEGATMATPGEDDAKRTADWMPTVAAEGMATSLNG